MEPWISLVSYFYYFSSDNGSSVTQTEPIGTTFKTHINLPVIFDFFNTSVNKAYMCLLF